MNPAVLADFRTAAVRCAHVMMENAHYVEKEIGAVAISPAQREAIDGIVKAFVANWFDVRTELDEMAELGESDGSPVVQRRVERIHVWLGEDLPQLDATVAALSAAAEDEPRFQAAFVLVSESAANVLAAFAAVRRTRDRYVEECERSSYA